MKTNDDHHGTTPSDVGDAVSRQRILSCKLLSIKFRLIDPADMPTDTSINKERNL